MEARNDKLMAMEETVNKNNKVELIHLAIQQLIEEKKKNKTVSGNDDDDGEEDEDHLLLSRLLSQVELLKDEDNSSKLPDEPLIAGTKEPLSSRDVKEEEEMGTEEILKELEKVKKQNNTTHWLLSVMIFLTVAWQLSEVSLILNVKNTFRNPLGSVGNVMKWAMKGLKEGKHKEIDCSAAAKSSLSQLETSCLPALKIPELPHMDLHVLGLNNGSGHDDED